MIVMIWMENNCQTGVGAAWKSRYFVFWKCVNWARLYQGVALTPSRTAAAQGYDELHLLYSDSGTSRLLTAADVVVFVFEFL